jgi:hypothetical protein
MIRTLAITVLCGLAASPAALATPDPTALSASIDKATPKKANDRDPTLVAKAEILLDRAHVSPGEIDGLDGDNFHNAVRAFQQVNRLPVSGDLDAATWEALKRDDAPILKAYTITLADAAGPFTRAIPSNLGAMARLPGLSYTSAQSELAEKFHMSPPLLRALNPRVDFARAGTELTVANVPEMLLRSGRPSVEAVPPPNPPKAKDDLPEMTIVVDKPARNVRVYDHRRQVPRLLSGEDRQRGKARAERGLQGQGHFLEPEIRIRPQICVEGRQYEAEALDRPWPKQSRRPGLDRPDRSDLRNPWHAGAVRHWQDSVSRLHPPDELGRG